MGVVFDGLARSTISNAVRKVAGTGIELEPGRDLRARLLASAAEFTGKQDQLRAAVRQLALQPISKAIHAGDRLRHRSSGRTARAMRPERLGNGWDGWQVLTDDAGLESWPVDEIEAQGESEFQPMPGGSQGGYAGQPFIAEQHAQQKATYFSSMEGQRQLAKSIRPSAPMSTFAGFETERRELAKRAAERTFKPGQPLIHPRTGKRGKFILSHGGHAVIEGDDGEIFAAPHEEFAEALPGSSAISTSADDGRSVYGSPASARPQIKVTRRGPLQEITLSAK